MASTFFTIGHSTRPIAEFVDLLRDANIESLVDVRSAPTSRKNPQFDGEDLSRTLASVQIGYEHIVELGGHRGKVKGTEPQLNAYWRVQSFHNYADYALTADFAAGFTRLLIRGRQRRCAIMCAEAVWWRCHRRIIADYLIAAGERVMHILNASNIQEASLTAGAVVRGDRTIVYPVETQALR